MLYSCSCPSFDREKNNFRKIASTFILSIFKKNNQKLDRCLILFFEVGGLAHECDLLESIIFLFPKTFFDIVFIETMPTGKTDEAYLYCKNKFSSFVYLSFFYLHCVDDIFLRKDLFERHYDFVLFGSFDPYFYLCFLYREKIIKKLRYSFLLEVYLYIYNGYHYQEMIEFFIDNKDSLIHGLYSLHFDYYRIREKKRD